MRDAYAVGAAVMGRARSLVVRDGRHLGVRGGSDVDDQVVQSAGWELLIKARHGSALTGAVAADAAGATNVRAAISAGIPAIAIILASLRIPTTSSLRLKEVTTPFLPRTVLV